MIVIVDYGMGNLGNVERCCRRLGEEVRISSDPDLVERAEKLILPGVGAFGQAMRNLASRGLIDPLDQQHKAGVPILGICLGLQLFFEESEEDAGVKGLGWIPGKIVKFRKARKVPQIGWNTVEWVKSEPLIEGIPEGTHFYFVHSYFAPEREYSLGISEYSEDRFTAVLRQGNIYATQFHPEKSHKYGFRLMKNFLVGKKEV